jgi:kynureninase
MDLPTRFRPRFPITSRCVYLMTNSMGAMPDTVPAALMEYARIWSEKGALAWFSDFLPKLRSTADHLGRIIGAPPGRVMIQQNVSTLYATLLSALDFSGRRNKIVYTNKSFPTIHHVSERAAPGAEIVVVPSPDGIDVPAERILEAIDERTRLVTLDHVFFGSGAMVDVAPIVRRAHDVGALVCVDIYQSVGAVPIDVAAWDCDFALGGSHKYLCGGTGACFLYVRGDHIGRLEPRITGWLSHEGGLDMKFESLRYREGIERFTGGAPSIAPLYVAPCGYELVLEASVEAIRRHLLALGRRAIERADALGLRVNSPRDDARRGGSVHVDFSGIERVAAQLPLRGVHCHYRPAYGGFRVAPHFYNTIEEIDLLFDMIGDLRRE